MRSSSSRGLRDCREPGGCPRTSRRLLRGTTSRFLGRLCPIRLAVFIIWNPNNQTPQLQPNEIHLNDRLAKEVIGTNELRKLLRGICRRRTFPEERHDRFVVGGQSFEEIVSEDRHSAPPFGRREQQDTTRCLTAGAPRSERTSTTGSSSETAIDVRHAASPDLQGNGPWRSITSITTKRTGPWATFSSSASPATLPRGTNSRRSSPNSDESTADSDTITADSDTQTVISPLKGNRETSCRLQVTEI